MDGQNENESADEGFVDDSNIEEGMDMVHMVNADDVDEVIDSGDEVASVPEEEQVVEGIGEMDLENYDDDDDEAEGQAVGSAAEAAAAAAFTPPRNDANMAFTKHNGSVFCVSLDPVSETLAITGAEDDKAFVWRLDSGEVMFECSGHKDSVTCAGFSSDSKYVASGDMSGLLKVWNVESGQEVWSFEVSDLEWLEWHPLAPVLLAGSVDGTTWMWKIPSGDCKTFQGHTVANIGKYLPDGKRACVGYEDGVVKLWDLKTGDIVHTFSGPLVISYVKGFPAISYLSTMMLENFEIEFTGHVSHSSSVTSMDCHQDNNLVVTGSTDVTARIFNMASGKLLTTLSVDGNARASAGEGIHNSVEAVGFSHSQNSVALGTLMGELSIWDISTQKRRHQCMHEGGIVRLQWDAHSPLVYTCSLDGTCNLWDARTGLKETTWYGHMGEVLDMAVSRNGSMVVTASGDNTASVFSLHKPDR